MARVLMPVLMTLIVTGIASWALRTAFPNAYRSWLRRTLWLGWLAGASLMGLWRIARALEWDATGRLGATGTAVLWVSLVALTLTAPLYVLPAWWLRRRAGAAADATAEAGVQPERRALLKGALGVIPASAVSVGPIGAVAASVPPVVRRVEVRSALVPPTLSGLRILQLTDVHLGVFMDVAQVRAAVEAVRNEPPDLIVLTGDIADDFSLFPGALAALHELAPRHGIFACIGNHEIYRGRAEAEAHLARGNVTLLCGSGVEVQHEGASFWLCGADDPARLGEEHRPFLERTVQDALRACPDDVRCRVLLSHRPEAFEAAASAGVALTLSGHTHGAQMALWGRSLLEWALPRNYLLGLYRQGESALYTSAGLGHWFPFRLNCPCEVAMVTLRAPEARVA